MSKFFTGTFATMCLCLSVIISFVRCSSPDSVFVGEIEVVEMTDNVRELKGEPLVDFPIPFPVVAVCDTIAITYSPNPGTDYSYRIYSARTGEELGAFVACGHGENEFISPSRITSLYRDDGNLKTLLFSPNERKIFVWNITQSLNAGTTVYEDMRSYGNMIEDGSTFNMLSRCVDEKYVVKMQSYTKYPEKEPVPHHYTVIDAGTLGEIGKISIVKGGIINDKSAVLPENFFSANARVNSRNGKIAEAMLWLGQINIADIESGEVRSYRLSESDGSEIFDGTMADAVFHYSDIACDDDYIYALWRGKKAIDGGNAEWIHKFDWKGNMIERIQLDKQIYSIWLDEAANTIYGYGPDEDRVYAYSLD